MKSGVVILTLPPHTTHKLQVLDIVMLGPFKILYGPRDGLMDDKPSRNLITDYDLTAIIKDAFLSAVTPYNIRQGLRKTGMLRSVLVRLMKTISSHLNLSQKTNMPQKHKQKEEVR
jgi:hypothetical protein